jgi:phthalate 4,5-dioxygenase
MDRKMAEILVRTGPGTVMGDLLRRYWAPVLHLSEIAKPDCPPVRVRILGEKLLAFPGLGRPAGAGR